MPAYSGTIALLIGIAVQLASFFGYKLPDDFAGQATQTIVAIISAATMVIGISRLLFTKNVATKLSAQVVAQGAVPIAGPDRGMVPTQADVLNAEEAVRLHARPAGVPIEVALPRG